ncbi:MAG: hypothetical protein ACJ8GN_15190 [Longimicrobiaceae bacterium]
MRFAPALLLVFSACVSIPLPHGRDPVSENQRPALARKMVAAKREPNHLVATDGSTCATTGSRFARVERGDRVWCLWRDEGNRPSTTE